MLIAGVDVRSSRQVETRGNQILAATTWVRVIQQQLQPSKSEGWLWSHLYCMYSLSHSWPMVCKLPYWYLFILSRVTQALDGHRSGVSLAGCIQQEASMQDSNRVPLHEAVRTFLFPLPYDSMDRLFGKQIAKITRQVLNTSWYKEKILKEEQCNCWFTSRSCINQISPPLWTCLSTQSISSCKMCSDLREAMNSELWLVNEECFSVIHYHIHYRKKNNFCKYSLSCPYVALNSIIGSVQ